jgi:hypothetical protein
LRCAITASKLSVTITGMTGHDPPEYPLTSFFDWQRYLCMSTSYIAYHPDHQYLFPCVLQDWLAQGHPAYYVNDTVDSLDLSIFHASYAVGASRNQPCHPAMTVKVLVYAYATGTNADEAENYEPDLDTPAEIERRQVRVAAIGAAKVRLEERQR